MHYDKAPLLQKVEAGMGAPPPLTCKLATGTCWNNGLGIFTAELVSGTLWYSRLFARMCSFEQSHHDVQS